MCISGNITAPQCACRMLSYLYPVLGRQLDLLYSRVGRSNGLFFPQGWGNLRLINQKEDMQMLSQWPPEPLQLNWRLIDKGQRGGISYALYESSFKTPVCVARVYDALSKEVRVARAQLLVPGGTDLNGIFSDMGPQSPATCVLHLAGTGDHGFQRRLDLGFPLLKQNVSTLVLESPFYGKRRPMDQNGSKLLSVTDLLLLGLITISEGLHLLHWASSRFLSVGLCGLSMGGVHSCMVAGLCPLEVALAALLTPRSAAVAYCDGAMRSAIAWDALQDVHFDTAGNSIEEVISEAPSRCETFAASTCGPLLGQNGVYNGESHPATEQLRRVLEIFTDIRSYPQPQRNDAICLVAAVDDAYVSQQSVASLKQHYPNANLRFVPGGHVSAYLTQKAAFRTAIMESLNKLHIT